MSFLLLDLFKSYLGFFASTIRETQPNLPFLLRWSDKSDNCIDKNIVQLFG